MNEDPHPLVMALMALLWCLLGYFLLVVVMAW
jgi:hypothetical protein